jgi:hypothetical protein
MSDETQETSVESQEIDTTQENAPKKSKLSASEIVDDRGIPLTNVMKELNRKVGRISELSGKLDLLLQQQTKPSHTSVDNTFMQGAELDEATRRYIDARLMEEKRSVIEKQQETTIQNVLKYYPELDRDSDSYDEEFYKLAVSYEKAIDTMDPERALKAAKLAALDTGRVERLTKSKVIQDDARRSRLLAEGGIEAKDSKKEKNSSINKSAIKNLLKIDPAKVERYMKESK